MSYTHAGPHQIYCYKAAYFSLLASKNKGYAEMYLDRLSALSLAKKMVELNSSTDAMKVLFNNFNDSICQRPGFLWTDDAYIEMFRPSIFNAVGAPSGRQLYRITISTIIAYIGREDLLWHVHYAPGEEFDSMNRDIEEYLATLPQLQSFQVVQHPFQQNCQLPPSMESYQISQQVPLLSNTSYQAPVVSALSPNTWGLEHSFAQFHVPSAQEIYQSPMSISTPFNVPSMSISTPLNTTSVRSRLNSEVSMSTTVQADESMTPLGSIQTSQADTIITEGRTPFQECNSGMTIVTSGYTTPEERMQDAAMSEVEGILRPEPRNQFISEFHKSDTEYMADTEAAKVIVELLKPLVLNPRPGKGNKHRFTILNEKQAIRSMTIDCTLNIGDAKSPLADRIKWLFKQYDKDDEAGQESFQRSMLMVVIVLLRHEFMYEEKKHPGNYATDFDKMFKFPDGYLRRARQLCRIIVAAGHPCILVLLVRIAILNRLNLSQLLDRLSINHFCQFVSSGRVTDHNFTGEKDSPHETLLWLHTNAFLPLLSVASGRVGASLDMLSRTLTCNDEKCLAAIVHHSYQNQYLGKKHAKVDWERGRVLLEVHNLGKGKDEQYSIAKEHRTVRRFNLAKTSHIEHFDNVPCLQKGMLPLV